MADTKDKGIRSTMQERDDATQQLDTFTVLQDVDDTNLDHKAYEPGPVIGGEEEALAANPLIAASETTRQGFAETTVNTSMADPLASENTQQPITALESTEFNTENPQTIENTNNPVISQPPIATNTITNTVPTEEPVTTPARASNNTPTADSTPIPEETTQQTTQAPLPQNDTLISTTDTVQTVYHYNETTPVKSLPNTTIEHVAISYNDTTHDFSFSLTFDDPGNGNNGVIFAINGGPNPLGHAGEMAMFYVDNSNPEPIITVYAYNGEGNMLSYTNNPDTIMTSLGDNTFSSINTEIDANGHHILSFNMDATPIINHTPVGGSTEDWSGVAFGDEIGIWLFPITAVQSEYNSEGYLTDLQFKSPEALDTTNSQTSKEYVPIGTGNDILDGGDGLDTAVYAGNFEDYTISRFEDGFRLTDTQPARDGDDLAFNIEFFQFADDTYSVNESSWLDALEVREGAPAVNPLLAQAETAIDFGESLLESAGTEDGNALII